MKIKTTLSKELMVTIAKATKGVRKSPPKGYPKDKVKYADPKNYKYPVDTKARALAAWRYIHMPKNQKGYSSSELSKIKNKIKAALKKFKVDFKNKTASLQLSIRDVPQ